MPTYTIRDPRSNRTIVVRGDSPPSEAELQQLFASVGPPTPAPTAASGPVPNLGAADMFQVPRRFLGAVASDLNPLPLLQHVWQTAQQPSVIPGMASASPPEIAGRLIWDLLRGQGAELGKSVDAAREGRTSEAIGHGVAGVLPVVGPAAARVGETIGRGEIPEGLGQATALLGSMGLPAAVRAAAPPRAVTVGPLARHPNPVVAQAVDYGLARRMPVEMGPAIGSEFLTGATELFEHTPLGHVVGRRAARATEEALAGEATNLQGRAFPVPVVPEQAGRAVQQLTARTAATEAGKANTAYGRLRELEAAPEAGRLVNARTGTIELPGVTPGEVAEVRRMLAELEEVQYTRRGMHETTGQGKAAEWTAGHRNAYVFEDIMNEAGGTSKLPAVELRGKIEAVLNGERPNVWFERAVSVARKRLAKDRTVHEPLLPPDAGEVGVEIQAPMQAPVDLTAAKARLKTVAEGLEADLAPLKGLPGGMRLGRAEQASSEALVNVRRLLDLPDLAPASAVDPLLSSLKAYLRKADSPLARTRGQGIVGRVVSDLEEALAQGLAELGPEAGEALTAGRAATKAKYEALDLQKGLGKRPVLSYRRMVQPGDANVDQLASVLRMNPTAQPVVARGYLQSLVERGTTEGGFAHAARLKSEWQKLGPKTKALLFPDAAYRADLDKFFTLAAETTRPFNTSKSALAIAAGASLGAVGAAVVNPIGTLVSVLGTGAFVKAMHNPAFVRAVTQGMQLPVRARAQRTAAFQQAVTLGRSITEDTGEGTPGR